MYAFSKKDSFIMKCYSVIHSFMQVSIKHQNLPNGTCGIRRGGGEPRMNLPSVLHILPGDDSNSKNVWTLRRLMKLKTLQLKSRNTFKCLTKFAEKLLSEIFPHCLHLALNLVLLASLVWTVLAEITS